MGWIQLEGAVNVRDLGGLPAANGSVTAAGRLIRSANLQLLSPADVKKLVSDIGVTTVVDLRSAGEVAAEGPAPLDGVTGVRREHHQVLSELGAVAGEAPGSRNERDMLRYPDDPVCGRYLGYIENRPAAVVAALRAVAGSDGAVIVHCAAGKDRTGVVVALALTAVGVRPEAVIADYAATSEQVAVIIEQLRRSPIYREDLDRKTLDEHRALASTMAAFLAELDTRHGGVLEWLAANGFADRDLALLRESCWGKKAGWRGCRGWRSAIREIYPVRRD
jgi:protein-tyrosine phosphatase